MRLLVIIIEMRGRSWEEALLAAEVGRDAAVILADERGVYPPCCAPWREWEAVLIVDAGHPAAREVEEAILRNDGARLVELYGRAERVEEGVALLGAEPRLAI